MMHRSFNIAAYPFVFLLTALVTGIVLQQQMADISGIMWFVCCIFFTTFTALAYYTSSIKFHFRIIRNALLFLSFSFLGMAIAYYQNVQQNGIWYGRSLKKITALNVQITEVPITKAKTYLLWASVKSINQNGCWTTANGNIKIFVYKGEDSLKVNVGQSIIIPNQLTEIATSKNPFSFDQTLYANRNGIYHQCFLSSNQLIISNNSHSGSFINSLRQSIQSAIHENVKDTTTMALMDAMLLNDRVNIDQDLQQAYATTGIIHILSISGMHVLLLAGIILWLLGKIPIKRLQQWKYLVALILVWIYIAVTGFPPSANRSAIMFSVYAIGIILQKDRFPLNTWAASGLLLLYYNPYWIYDIGFQLSFLAVLSMLLFTKGITNWWQPKNKILNGLWKGIAVSISVQILVFPLVIYYFNQFPILVFLANIPAGLYSTVLMIGAIGIFVLHLIGIGSLWIGQLLALITKTFNAFIMLLSSYSPQSFRMFFIDAIDYWLMMGYIIFICLFCYYKKANLLFSSLIFAILLILNFTRKDRDTMHQERIVVYNLNKESQVDIFKGKSVLHLYPVNQQQYNYALKRALIGFHAKQETIDTTKQSLFRINGKNILLLRNSNIDTSISFPVDVLLVSNDCIFEPEKWFTIFHPKKVIIDGSVPRWKAIKWKTTLEQAGAKVHAVVLDGAWIYPSLQQ